MKIVNFLDLTRNDPDEKIGEFFLGLHIYPSELEHIIQLKQGGRNWGGQEGGPGHYALKKEPLGN